jgi:hypothetical protein
MYQQPQKKHHLRFYIFMSALVLGGIFLVLFLNDNSEISLTSFTVKDLVGSGSVEEDSVGFDELPKYDKEIEKVFGNEVRNNPKEVNIDLSFDRIPTLQKKAKIKNLELTFDDLTTKIKVNADKLELSNLREVSLRIGGFEGNIDLSEDSFSLDGTARSIAVNDVTLSSKGEISIAFEDLDYRTFNIDEIELVDLELYNGEGELKVEDKLTYTLEQDEVKIYYFNGQLAVDRDVDESLKLEGVARGISISGALLNLNLR